MEASFVICLLTASITLGNRSATCVAYVGTQDLCSSSYAGRVSAKSQECTVCQSSGKICQGAKKECSPLEDECSIILMKKTLESTSYATKKSCIHSQDCKKGLAVLDFGNNRTIQGYVSCCKDDQCASPPNWPERKMATTNNKKCPACFTKSNECIEKTMNCRGEDETYCAEVFLQKNEGGKNMTTIMKGCANKAFCDKMEISAIASSFTLLPNSNCTIASRAVDTTTGSLGLFLLAQAGLLLVTISS